MFKVIFYKKRSGKCPAGDYIEEIKNSNNKQSRNNYIKIMEYIKLLECKGLSLGMPFIRKIKDGLWELRPQKNRIMFFCYKDDTFILLHGFVKKTKKTPENEKIKAEEEIKDYLRGEDYEK